MLRLLNLNYLDLVLIHWPGVSRKAPEDKLNAELRTQTWKALEELQKEGKIRHIGVSNFLVKHLQ
jgi:diketogulonate reductase-like aldo/keto reductase